jgi:hypothetical protein
MKRIYLVWLLIGIAEIIFFAMPEMSMKHTLFGLFLGSGFTLGLVDFKDIQAIEKELK